MAPSLEESYAYCTNLTRSRARNFYYAFITLPKEKRKAIYAAYAFCRLSDDYSDEEIPVDEKAALLSGLHDLVDKAFSGTPDSEVFVALMDASERYSIPKDYFHEIIKGVEMDLEINRYADFDELYQYCYRVASVVGLVCIEIFEYTDPRALGVRDGHGDSHAAYEHPAGHRRGLWSGEGVSAAGRTGPTRGYRGVVAGRGNGAGVPGDDGGAGRPGEGVFREKRGTASTLEATVPAVSGGASGALLGSAGQD